jgi:competence protein ComEC
MRADAPLVLGAAALLGQAAVTAPAPACAAGGGLLAVLGLGGARPALLAGAAVVSLGASLRGAAEIRSWQAQRDGMRQALAAPARCVGNGRIDVSPVRRRGATILGVTLEELECEGRRLPGGVRARLYGGPERVGRGDRFVAVAQLAPVAPFRNAELADPVPATARNGAVVSGGTLSFELRERGAGPGALVDRARAHARARIEASFAPEAAPLARALVLGENDLDPEDDEAFRRGGLSHLLAVSGTHLVFAVLGVVGALAALLVRVEAIAARIDARRPAALGGAALALAYADFAGGSGSAWRAAWMLSAALAARAFDRHPSPARSLGVSLCVGCAVDPLAAYDLSLLLSAAATAGLIVVAPSLVRRAGALRPRPLAWLAAALATTLSAMLPCAPLLAAMAPELTLAGLFANVVAAPLGETIALPLCLAHPLLGLAALERGVGLVASGALLLVERIAHASAATTWLAVPVPAPGAWHWAVLALGAGAMLTLGSSWRARAAWCAATLLLLVPPELALRRRPSGVVRATFLDVGQGDAALIDLPDGSLMLVDGGGMPGGPDPGRQVILPLLRARRRTRVDVAVLTHPHPDHFTGLASALPSLEVGELWDTGQGDAQGAGPVYAGLLAGLRARGVAVVRPERLCAAPRRFGTATVEVLAPCPGFDPRRGANDNSLVLRVQIGARSLLLAGDAEAEAEARLVEAHRARLRSDLLKVGHHGSATSSTPAFVASVRPDVAVVSSGARNRFGHPHPRALAALAGSRVLRTDELGSIEWWTDGRRAWLGRTGSRAVLTAPPGAGYEQSP